MKKIVVLGSTNTDMVVTGKKILVPGETVAWAAKVAHDAGVADAIAFAQKASAISVTRPGAQSSVPYRREIR